MKRRSLVIGALASLVATRMSSTAYAAKRPKPMVEPTEIAPGLTLLYYQVIPSDGTWTIYGEARNDTGAPTDAPFVLFRFVDDVGNVYFQDYATPVSHVTQPGEHLPFDLEMSVEDIELIDGWKEIAVSACSWGDTTIVAEQSGIKLEIVRETLKQDADDYWLRGMVQVSNNGTTPSYRPWVVAVFRDEKGRVNGIDTGYVDSPIEPGTFMRSNVSLRAPSLDADYELRMKEDTVRFVSC